MATLLEGVNETLKRVGEIDTDTGTLQSLSVSARQMQIDLAVQLWNEAVDELYDLTDEPRTNNLVEDNTTIVLSASQRAYELPEDLVQMLWPLHDETNGQWIGEYPGGYMELVNSQLHPENYTGLPLAAAVRPSDEKLYLDRIPTATEAGRVYVLRYLKDTALESASDQFPFKDDIFRALVTYTAERWEQIRNKLQGGDLQVSRHNQKVALARAARRYRRTTWNHNWGPERIKHITSPTDPLEK